MDPLTHTLFGASLAATGLARRTPLATATLVIGANLPDVDVLSYLAGSDAGLAHRRGWTHGVLAMVLLPLVLTGLVLAYDRWRRRRGATPPGSAPHPGWILALSYLSVLSHPSLDWLNTYGMRWLMPFDGRWFYGDAVFIVDPWLWLTLGGSLFLLHSETRRARVRWAVLAFLTTTAVLVGTPRSGLPGHLLWVLWLPWGGTVLALVWLRLRGIVPRTPRTRLRVARIPLAVAVVYMLTLVGSARLARQHVLADLEHQGIRPVEGLMVGPVPANPLAREVVVETPDGYRYGTFRWLAEPRTRLRPRLLPKPRPPEAAITEAAYGARGVRGMMGWARFPFAQVEENGDSYRIHIMDLRYTKRPTSGFGGATVVLDRRLEPTEAVVGR